MRLLGDENLDRTQTSPLARLTVPNSPRPRVSHSPRPPLPASPRPPLTESSLRLFFAIESPAGVRASVAEHIECLRAAAPDVRVSWERPEKLHITLKFLGDVPADQLASIAEAASIAVADTRPFPITVTGTGAFPPRGTPRVLWIGIDDASRGLAELQSKLEDACERVGFRRESRAFHPHLTIARIRAPQGAAKLAKMHEALEFQALEYSTSELLVMRSELAPGGSRYLELSRHTFASRIDDR